MLQDRIILKNLQAFCRLGAYDHERILGQSLIIHLELELDLAPAAKSNKIEDTIDYVEVSLIVRRLAQSREFLLIENLAQEITDTLLQRFNILQAILIEINKTIVNAEQFTGNPSIKIYRKRP